jgi:putative spermidine/putrescine transport system substrate-binding protein
VRRRKLLQAAAATLAAPHPARAAGPSGEVTVMGFFGIFQDNFTRVVLQPFMQQFPDIKVTFRPVLGSAQATAMVRTQRAHPSADVVIMDLSVAEQNNRDGLFAPLDEAVVPNLTAIPPWGRPAGNRGAALTQDLLVILYNPHAVKKAPTSWADLADPIYAGRLGMPIGDIRGVVLLAILDRMAGADYKVTVDPAIAALKKIAPNVQTYEPQPDPYTAIRSGLIDVAIGWNARGQANHDQAPDRFLAIVPIEGTGPQINTINLVAGAPNPSAAQTFINYALSAPAQQAFAEALYYGPTNQNAALPPALNGRIFGSLASRQRQLDLDWTWFSSHDNALIQRIRREVIAT